MKKMLLSAVALMATLSLFAQGDLTTTYNNGANALQTKNFAEAAKNFEQVIAEGEGSEDNHVLELVSMAKSVLPRCYYMLGGAAFQSKNYDEAMLNFTESAALAKEYGDEAQAARSNQWVANLYQAEGGEAFNSRDYLKAAEIFEKGYAANPSNLKMANWLGTCYCEIGEYEKGMRVLATIASDTIPANADEVKEAMRLMALYTNNKVAALQQEGNYDGIIIMADAIIEQDAKNAVAHKVRLQAYSDKKDLAKVMELGEIAASMQTEPEDISTVYSILGAAYVTKEMRAEAITALKKVTVGPNVAAAKTALAALTQAS